MQCLRNTRLDSWKVTMEHISELAVLVVDDQPIINEFYRKILEQLGCKWIFSALSGQDAMKRLAERGDINLVLTDIDMQPGNGLELLQAIRCGDIDNTPRDLCVLVVSDYNYRHNVMKAVGLDCQGFLSKPLNAAVLAEKIQAALHRAIQLADPDTYRGISTEIRVNTATSKASQNQPLQESAAGMAPTDTETDAEPQTRQSTETKPLTPCKNDAPPDLSQQAVLEAAADKLLPAGMKDSFLHYKHDSIHEILQMLYKIGDVLGTEEPEALQTQIKQLEQLSSDLFQQEYLHQREHGYQPLSAHQAEHGLILQRTQMLTGKVFSQLPNRVEHLQKAHQQLLEAWHRHINGKDRQYVDYLQNQIGVS